MKTNSQKAQSEFPDFVSEVDNLSADALKARIVQLQQALQESEMAREADEELSQTRAQARELAAPYNDVRSAVKIKTTYIIELLKEKI